MPGVQVIAWLHPRQGPLVKEACRLAGIDVVAAGSSAHGQSRAVADALNCRAVDDLRQELTAADVHAFLVFAAGDFGTDPGGADSNALLSARARGVQVLSIEPIPASVAELSSGRWLRPKQGVAPAECLAPMALFARSEAMARAAETLAAFGPPRTFLLENLCSSAFSSLGARLFDSMHLVHALMGEPEGIDAACVAPRRSAGLHAIAGESLRELTGDCTANVRFTDGRAAAILASDQADRLLRRLTLLSGNGRLEITDHRFAWVDSEGKTVDSWEAPPADDAGVLASALKSFAERRSDAGPVDVQSTLAMTQAALLSVRTGQAEAPSMIRRIFEPSV